MLASPVKMETRRAPPIKGGLPPKNLDHMLRLDGQPCGNPLSGKCGQPFSRRRMKRTDGGRSAGRTVLRAGNPHR
jgi:hypothetical protein